MHINDVITALPYHPLHPFLSGLGVLGLILAVLIWLLPVFLIAGVIDLVTSPSNYPREYEDSAVQTLRQRYARGEISKEEYQQKIRDLT